MICIKVHLIGGFRVSTGIVDASGEPLLHRTSALVLNLHSVGKVVLIGKNLTDVVRHNMEDVFTNNTRSGNPNGVQCRGYSSSWAVLYLSRPSRLLASTDKLRNGPFVAQERHLGRGSRIPNVIYFNIELF